MGLLAKEKSTDFEILVPERDVRHIITIQTRPSVCRNTVLVELMNSIRGIQVDRFEVFMPTSPDDKRNLFVFEFVTKGLVGSDVRGGIYYVIDRFHDIEAECDGDDGSGLAWAFDDWCSDYVMDKAKRRWLKLFRKQALNMDHAIRALEQDYQQDPFL